MPLYEYQCQQCGEARDIRHGFDETTTETCNACGGALARRFRPAGIVFKGSGFYVTDSRKSSNAASSEKKSDGGDAGSKSDAPKTEKKTDTAAA